MLALSSIAKFIELKFTPLEFETFIKLVNYGDCDDVKIYSVGV